MKSIVTLRTALILVATIAIGCEAPADDEIVEEEEQVGVAQDELFGTVADDALKNYFGETDFSNFASALDVVNQASRPKLVVDRVASNATCPSKMHPRWGSTICDCDDYTDCEWQFWEPTVYQSCPSGYQNDYGTCYAPCPISYTPNGSLGALGCTIDNFGANLAEHFYDPTFQLLANTTGKWYFYGIGTGGGEIVTAAFETGVAYGPNNQFGYYTSSCTGFMSNVGLGAYVVMGGINTIGDFEGNGRQWGVGLATPIAGVGEGANLQLDESGMHVVGASIQASVGIDLLPFTVSTATCDTNYDELHRTSPSTALPIESSDGGTGNTFYTIGENGTLYKSRHRATGGFDMVNEWIHSGWSDADKIFAAEGGHVYVAKDDGYLYYNHFNQATGSWDVENSALTVYNGVAVVASHGWAGSDNMWAGKFGEIYKVAPDGTLTLYRHDANRKIVSQQNIGSGWNSSNFYKVFGGGHNTVYIISNNGDLLEYRHDDNGAFYQTAEVIGWGWTGFDQIASTGNGEIYAMQPDGVLRFYRREADAWVPGSGGVIGSNWAVWTDNDYGFIASQF